MSTRDYYLRKAKRSGRDEDWSWDLAQVTNGFIYKQLQKLKASKATGLDGVPSRLLKDSAVTISAFLTHIVNLSITSQRIPHDWKHAKVIPLYKEGARDDIDNYRPISILPVVLKILQRAVQQQLVDYLESRVLFSRYQCRFRRKYLTQSAITFLGDSVRRNSWSVNRCYLHRLPYGI